MNPVLQQALAGMSYSDLKSSYDQLMAQGDPTDAALYHAEMQRRLLDYAIFGALGIAAIYFFVK